jgi:hypothetical protein
LVERMQNNLVSQAQLERVSWTSLRSQAAPMQWRPARLHARMQRIKGRFLTRVTVQPHCCSPPSSRRTALLRSHLSSPLFVPHSSSSLSPPLSLPLPFLSCPLMVGLQLFGCSSLPSPPLPSAHPPSMLGLGLFVSCVVDVAR